MTLTTTPAATHTASGSPFDVRAPLRLPADLRLTPEQFELVCAANREAVLELSADGLLIAMTPTGTETSSRTSELVFQLQRSPGRAAPGKCSSAPAVFCCLMGPSKVLMLLCCGWSAGRHWPPSSGGASPPSVPIWWWSWRVLPTKAPEASVPCIRRWPLTRPMAPASAGCSFPASRPWRCGPPAACRNGLRPAIASRLVRISWAAV
jgi:hypothetical protein